MSSVIAKECFATHVVVVAVYVVVLGQATPKKVFTAMIGMLKRMHDDNPSWGLLFVGHRGDSGKHLVIARR